MAPDNRSKGTVHRLLLMALTGVAFTSLAFMETGCSSGPPARGSREDLAPVRAVEKKETHFEKPTAEELQLHSEINLYRKQQGLSVVPLAKSLTQVARLHARDLNEHPPVGACNYHSWSAKGPWKSCCYTADHAQAKCMWDKPRELTGYPGKGYENAFWRSSGAYAENALRSWKLSPGHNAVILNHGIWKNRPWNSMGVGINGKYATVWFGEEQDPAGYWR